MAEKRPKKPENPINSDVKIALNVNCKYYTSTRGTYDLGNCILVKGLYHSLVQEKDWDAFIANPEFPDWTKSIELIEVIIGKCKFNILHIYIDTSWN